MQYILSHITRTCGDLINAGLPAVSFAGAGKAVPAIVKEQICQDAAKLAALCLIITDQAGCDLLDPKAVDQAVNEVHVVGKIGEIISGPGKKEPDAEDKVV